MKIITALLLAGLLAGCASITDGTDQTIIVNVQPIEAVCSVSRDNTELGQVSGVFQTIHVSKGAKDIIIACRAPNYLPKTARLVSTTQAAGMASVFFLDFGITDMITGAMWKYPGSISVIMEREAAQAAAPAVAPAVATVSAAPASAPLPAAAAVAPTAVATAAPDSKPLRSREPAPKDAYAAERFAKATGCADIPATLIGRGAGYESFSFRCTSGDIIVVQCEMGNCRTLK